jgi:xylose isomerase
MKLNVDAHLWCLGTYAERYVPGGYFEPLSLDQQLQIMSKVEGLSGLFVFYPTPPLPTDPDKLVKKLADHNLKVSELAVECWSDRKWKHGGFSTNEDHIRRGQAQRGHRLPRRSRRERVAMAHDGLDHLPDRLREGWKLL